MHPSHFSTPQNSDKRKPRRGPAPTSLRVGSRQQVVGRGPSGFDRSGAINTLRSSNAHPPRAPQTLPRKLVRNHRPHPLQARRRQLRTLRRATRPAAPGNRQGRVPIHRPSRPRPDQQRRRKPGRALPHLPQPQRQQEPRRQPQTQRLPRRRPAAASTAGTAKTRNSKRRTRTAGVARTAVQRPAATERS